MKPMSGPDSFHSGASTGRTVAMAMASNAWKNVATPTMIRVLTCHHEVGSRSIRATTLSTAPAGAAEPVLMTSSPDYFEEFYQCYILLPQCGRLVSPALFWHRLPPCPPHPRPHPSPFCCPAASHPCS